VVDDLLERTRQLVAERNRLDAELARTVRRAENEQAFAGDGMTTAQSWLRGHCRLSAAAASQVVRNGRVLEQLPAVAEAHAAGQITADEVAVIGKITAPGRWHTYRPDGTEISVIRPSADDEELARAG
jgi:hypothetical protein